MGIGTVIKIAKAGCVAATVVLPAVEAATVVAKGTAKFIKNKMDNSEKIQEIKKDYKLRKEGVITVDYIEC